MNIQKMLAALVMTVGLGSAQAVEISLPVSWSPQDWWTNSGLVVRAGDAIDVTSTGVWNAFDGNYGADGSTVWWPDQFLSPLGAFSGDPTPVGTHFGGLIGYIGETPPPVGSYLGMSVEQRLEQIARMVVLGSNVHVIAPLSGALWLGMNDDAYSGNLSDNSGAIQVNVRVTSPVPEPETYALMLAGLAVVGAAVKRRKSA
jgi:hypothetical protein